jgi:uncharacterized coiled-coil protein SlyX
MAPRIETAEDLEQIVAEQTAAIKGLGELVKAMDQRIRLQQALIDGLHAILVANGMATPRPKADPLAN